MNALPLVSVIIVNFNGKRFLKDCLDSLYGLNYPQDRLEIIMVDNCSSDDSVEFVKRDYPRVSVILNKDNNYCRANNLGIAQAKGEYTALINNDVRADKNWLKELVKAMESDKKIGAATGKVLFMDSGRIQSTGHRPYSNFYWGDRGFQEEDKGQYEKIEEVQSACGCSVLYRKACLEDVGLLDEDFVMYMEDVDMSVRCTKKGWKLVYVPGSVIHHKYLGSANQGLQDFYVERNRLLFIAKYYPLELGPALEGKGYFTGKNEERLHEAITEAILKLISFHNSNTSRKIIVDILKNLKRFHNFDIEQELKQKDIKIKSQEMSLHGQEIILHRKETDYRMIKEELDSIYSSTGFKYLLRPLWTVLWGIKLFLRNIKRLISIDFRKLNKIISYFENKPHSVHITLTHRCNLSCAHCDIGRVKDTIQELTTEQWKEIISKLNKWLGRFDLHFSGGEPLLRNDIWELIKFCSQRGIRTFVITNGTLISEEIIKKMLDANLFGLTVSLDTLSPEKFETLRGRKDFHEKVLKNIGYIHKTYGKRISVTIATILMGYNLEEILDLVNLVKTREVAQGIIFQPLVQNFGSAYNPDWYKNNPLWLNQEDKFRYVINKLIEMKKRNLPIGNPVGQLELMKVYFKNPRELNKRYVCNTGTNNLNLTINGDVLLCWNMEPVGNLLKDSPERIWRSKKADIKRKEIAACIEYCRLLNCNFTRLF